MVATDLHTRWRRKSCVSYRQLPDRTLLLDTLTGECFEINQFGSEVWALLDGALSLEEVCQRLEGRFQVSAPALRTDVGSFAAALGSAGLTEEHG